MAFSPNGKLIATGDTNGTTKLWDRGGRLVEKFEAHQGHVFSVAFSPDSNQIATGGSDGTTKLWDRKGTPLGELKGNQRKVKSVAFSPDGKLIATGGSDGITKLWDRKGTSLGQIEGGYPSALSSNWQTIAISTRLFDSDKDIVRLYRFDLNLDSLLSRACQHLKNYLLYTPELKDDRLRCEPYIRSR